MKKLNEIKINEDQMMICGESFTRNDLSDRFYPTILKLSILMKTNLFMKEQDISSEDLEQILEGCNQIFQFLNSLEYINVASNRSIYYSFLDNVYKACVCLALKCSDRKEKQLMKQCFQFFESNVDTEEYITFCENHSSVFCQYSENEI